MTQAHAPLPVRHDPWHEVPTTPSGEHRRPRALSGDTVARRPAPSGWYPDPPKLRFWNGEHWTDAVRLAVPPDSATRVSMLLDRQAPATDAPPAPFQPSPPAAPPQTDGAPWGPPPSTAAAPTLATLATAATVAVAPGPATAEPPPEVTPPPAAGAGDAQPEDAPARSIWRELGLLFLVATVALLAGAAVTAIGIALTV